MKFDNSFNDNSVCVYANLTTIHVQLSNYNCVLSVSIECKDDYMKKAAKSRYLNRFHDVVNIIDLSSTLFYLFYFNFVMLSNVHFFISLMIWTTCIQVYYHFF